MNLPDYYDAMHETAVPKLARGEADFDALIDSAQDNRRGFTLLTRPPAPIVASLEAILADFRASEPDQYYYPATDIHLTILSIISCYSGFTLATVEPAHYREAVRTILQGIRPFRIRFAGLTASPGGILVQGFPLDEGLARLRDATRKFFQQSSLQQSIDQRYSIQTAHSTVLRFKAPLANPGLLLEKLQKYRQQLIGTFEVTTIELVFNDWYQRAQHTVLLEKYALNTA